MKFNGSLLISTSLIAAVIYYGISVVSNHDSYISTNGLSTRIVESDFSSLVIRITNDADLLKDIEEKRKSDKKIIIDFLKTNGITGDNIVRTDTSIEDMLRWTEKTEGKKKYRVVDSIHIKSSDVHLIKKISEKLISEFTENNIIIDISIKYLYKALDKLRISMIEEASKDSRDRAEHIAKVSNMNVIGLRNLSTGNFSIVAEDSYQTSDSDYSEGEDSINKRIRVVVHGTFNVKNY